MGTFLTVEEIKQQAKDRYGKELTDEQAKELFEKSENGEISDEEPETVAGGISKGQATGEKYF